jgi:hypothetical protein
MQFKFIYYTLIYLILTTQGLLIPVTTPQQQQAEKPQAGVVQVACK